MNNIDFKDDNNTWSLSGQLQLMCAFAAHPVPDDNESL